MSDARLIAATKEFIPVRVVEKVDVWAWEKYSVQGIGVFVVLDHEGDEHVTIPMKDARSEKVVESWVTTLGEAWTLLKESLIPMAWQPSLEVAKQQSAETKKPIALVLVKATVPAQAPKEGDDDREDDEADDADDAGADEAPAPDAKSAAALAALQGREIGPQRDRFIWVTVHWTGEKPEAAGTYGLSRAPALALIDPDGKTVLTRITNFAPASLAAALHKQATKAEAKAARAAAKSR